MKKTLKLFGLAALVAIAFSCTKKDDPFIPGTPTDQTTPNEGQTEEPAVIPATDGGVLTSFGATVDSEATKVTVDLSDGETKGKTTIKDGDEVRVVDSEGHSSAIYVYDESQSKFVLKKGETAVTVKTTGVTGVYYPESEYDVMKDGTVQLALPAGIADDGDDDVADFGAAFGAINPMAGVITGDKTNGYSVTLNNIVSALRVKVSAEVNINSVTLDFGSDNKYAGAKFTVDPSTFTDPSTFADPSTSALTYVEGSGSASYESVELDTPALTADVLFLLPTVELTGGITVTANLVSNHNGGTNSFSLSKGAYTPVASKISTMSFYAGLFSGGAGTTDSPYIIANKRDFKHISEYCKKGYGAIGAADFLAANYHQVNDLNFNEEITAYMIGSSTSPFSGTYVGYKGGSESKTMLRFVTINASDDDAPVGIFRNVTGTIKHISVAVSTINGNEVVGALVGTLDGGTVSNCIYSGNTVTGSSKVGGLVGEAKEQAKISYCETQTGDAVNPGSAVKYVGGIVGQITSAQVTDCVNRASVTGNNYVGGIVGQVSVDAAISSCTNNGAVEAKVNNDNSWAGGIVGMAKSATIILCDNVGNVTAIRAGEGGIVGEIQGGMIDRCTNQADVTNTNSVGNNGNNVGGIGGYVNGNTIIKRCYSFHDATISGGTRIGGIVGNLIGTSQVVNCAVYSQIRGIRTGSVGNYGIGSIVGCQSGTSLIANCLARDNGVHVKNTGSDTQIAGGIVGWRNGGTLQNCYTVGILDNIQSKSKLGPALGDYVGQICGKSTGGTIKDCYYRGHKDGARALGSKTSGTTQTNIKCVSKNGTTAYTHGLVPVAITTSTGQSFAANEYYLKEILNGGLTATGGIDGYTPEEGESMSWDDISENYHCPVPIALKNLGEKFYNN